MKTVVKLACAWVVVAVLMPVAIVLWAAGVGTCPECPTSGRCRRCGR